MCRKLGKQTLITFMVLLLMFSSNANERLNDSASAQVLGIDVLYTTDADFDQGTMVSVNHDAPYNDQLQLDSPTEPFPFINVAASGRGTVVRANTETGEIVGEYRTAPEGRGLDPSRTTVDLFGNVWTANRGEVDLIGGVPHGSAVKIGLIVGGTRADADGTPNPAGDYLAPPFGYNTCTDRDNDGLIKTSRGLGDIRNWPDITDGLGGADGIVQDAEDECILIYQRLYNAEQARHVSVDADNNVWVGGYPFQLRMFYKLDSATGAILDSFDARDIGCGGYGGLIDGNGILWSVGGPLLRYDPNTRSGSCIREYGYGLGIDTNGYIWMSLWDGGIVKIAPDGTVVGGFPKPTYPPSMTSTSMATLNTSHMLATSSSKDDELMITPLAVEDQVTFQVAPNDDWVQSSSSWTPGATISLTIEDGGVVVYSDSQTADSGGNFHFSLWDVFDLQRGHVVTVSDGTTAKTHTVTNLFVDGVDVTADDVFGRADAGTSVDVWVHGDGSLTATADGSGNWAADFSGMTDITYLSDGASQQVDDDGDSTWVWWGSPRFQVAPNDNWVQSSGTWPVGASISLKIEDSGGIVYAGTQTADNQGYFNFELWDVFDLQRGHVVTVSDGTNTKTHTVTNLFVDGVDETADVVFGRADAGTSVEVWVHGDGSLTATADGSGNWIADFSGMTDLTYLSDGGSQQTDSDGDSTGVWWASPKIEVSPEDDWVQSWSRWTPGATISLTIEDGGVEVYSDSQTADSDGNFHFSLWDVFDLQRGHVVTVSDGTNTKTHTVTNLFVDGVDVTADVVFGRADAGTSVEVWVHGDGSLTATADGSGNWIADFSGMTDLTYLSDGGSRQTDSDGDSTGVWWASPSFHVSTDDGWVQSWNRWRPGATISLTIEDGGVVVYSGSQTADNHGNFNFSMWQGYLVPGYLVTVFDGTTTKTHTVIDVILTSIDTDADQIRGSASPGARVWVWVNMFDEGSGRWVTADIGGNWMADFSVPADGQPIFDITNITRIDVNEFDQDGDATQRRFGPPVQQNRGVAVTPIDNHVWVANSGVRTVTRLDNDGNVLKVIETGQEPTGVAVDAAGKVWATNMGSDNVVRIDPNAGPDGLGAIDLTVDLGPWASPYNYSDMTGAVVVGSTSPQGLWTVVQDSETPGFEWGRITWNNEPEGSEPPGTSIVVEARAADTEAGLGGVPFQQVMNGELFSMFGRFIEVRSTLKASPEGDSPVLSDIRVQPHVIYVDIDIKPGSYPNSINCENKNEVIAVAVLTTEDFDAMSIDHTTVTFEGASETHVNKKTGEPIRHVEDVDLDGDMDLVFHFRLGDTSLTCGSMTGTLTGERYDGIPVEGTDSVRMVKVGDCGYTPDSAGLSCQDIRDRCPGTESGEKWIEPDGTNAILAYCHMDEDGNGWTLIYNRNNAYFSPDQMYNELPAQGPDFSSNSTSWFIPVDATRWLWEVSVDSGASYRTLETSIPPEARTTTHATVVNAPIDTVYENTTGASGPFYFQTITFLDKCLYGCDSGQASWWGIVNVLQGAGDQDNPGLGGHTDWCSMDSELLPDDNYTWGDGDLEYYLSDWKDVGGDGIGGTNCYPYSPTTQYRYRYWAR